MPDFIESIRVGFRIAALCEDSIAQISQIKYLRFFDFVTVNYRQPAQKEILFIKNDMRLCKFYGRWGECLYRTRKIQQTSLIAQPKWRLFPAPLQLSMVVLVICQFAKLKTFRWKFILWGSGSSCKHPIHQERWRAWSLFACIRQLEFLGPTMPAAEVMMVIRGRLLWYIVTCDSSASLDNDICDM